MHSPVTASLIAQLAVNDRGATTRRRGAPKRGLRGRAKRRTQVD